MVHLYNCLFFQSVSFVPSAASGLLICGFEAWASQLEMLKVEEVESFVFVDFQINHEESSSWNKNIIFAPYFARKVRDVSKP